MTAQGERRLDVPEGLDGERLDAALARMFGLSRTKAAELIGDGLVLLDGRPAAKSDRVLAGEPLQVTLPSPRPAEPPRPVEGLIVLYEDDDIIVVDKPRIRRPAGPGRPSSAACWPPGTRWRPAAPPNARASCTAWTQTPRA
jgi:16S rRNA U516 pseudouridylate synthase RsuA-like enzyme